MTHARPNRKGETASLEDCLKAIEKLGDSDSGAGVTAISEELGIKKPSVTSAVERLKRKGLVEHESYGPVELTEKGRKIAREVRERHEVLFKFFNEILEVEDEQAAEDACRIEHHLSERTLERISTFVDFLLSRPRGEPIVLENFRQYTSSGTRNENMKGCCGD